MKVVWLHRDCNSAEAVMVRRRWPWFWRREAAHVFGEPRAVGPAWAWFYHQSGERVENRVARFLDHSMDWEKLPAGGSK